MTVQEALSYIHSIQWKGSVPGLSRTQELLRRMGNPQKKLKFIHIAGTNGKGSTAAMLSSILREAGCRTGLYTSPYITCFHERMQINGEMISDEELGAITEFVRPHAEAMEDHPTEFELITAIAFEFFARRCCEIVVLEVGMGGALDSTNVIDPPEVSVICNIGLDHTDYLGNTLEEIAENKAGIIKGGDTVFYPVNEAVNEVIMQRSRETGGTAYSAEFDRLRFRHASYEGQCFDCGVFTELFLPLLGEHQRKNCAVVLKTIELLQRKGWEIPEAAIYRGLRNTAWQGRFELLRRDPLFFADGGHNPQCMEALTKNIRELLSGKKLTALTGVMADKDFMQMYSMVAPYVSRFVTVTPDNPRSLPAAELGKRLSVFGKPVTVCDSVENGVQAAMELTSGEDVILAFGSLYMLGDIRRAVMQEDDHRNQT